jgi:hypothetical protein
MSYSESVTGVCWFAYSLQYTYISTTLPIVVDGYEACINIVHTPSRCELDYIP